jgi:hypothetical protein
MPCPPTSTLPPEDSGQKAASSPAFQPPTAGELSLLLTDYEVSALIAVGGMGAVYLARQPRHCFPLKCPQPCAHACGGDVQTDLEAPFPGNRADFLFAGQARALDN